MTSATQKVLTVFELAKLGVVLDDPYGDGIRVNTVREPTYGRYAALKLIEGIPILDGDEAITREYYTKVYMAEIWRKDGDLIAWAKRILEEL